MRLYFGELLKVPKRSKWGAADAALPLIASALCIKYKILSINENTTDIKKKI